MLIDDDMGVLESLGESLSSRGFSIKPFKNPKNAIEAYRSDKFDVVITDLKLPGINGFEVLRAVRARNPEAYVIILSSFDDPDNLEKAMNNGAYKFYRKPLLDMEDFVDTLYKIEQQMKR